jgi:hypothetical protein
MLWVDVMQKATAQFADVDCLYSHLTANGSEQTVGFWEFLDREVGDTDFSVHSEQEIGELYLRYHSQISKPSHSALSPYLRAVENGNWVHPISTRLYQIWSAHAVALRVHDPGAICDRWTAMPVEALIQRLAERDLCLDLRSKGGALYLDLTAEGIPLRQVITTEGHSNYLISLLRELVPQIQSYDHLILIHDRELHADYLLLQRILMRLGASVERVSISRVAIDGVVQSTRHGGWQGYTASDLTSNLMKVSDLPSIRLGMRLYFIATLGKGKPGSFNIGLLERAVRRAKSLILTADNRDSRESVESFLHRCSGRRKYVDPYKVTSGLLSKRRLAPFPREGFSEWYV